MTHEILPVGLLQCNCHIVGDPKTRDAVVIDPGDDVEKILEAIARHDLRVRAILITHTHIDHVGGLKKMRDATGAPVLMHEADLNLYKALEVQAHWIRWPVPELANVDDFLREGTPVRWGNFEAHVIHTPGHTEGSVCLYLPNDNQSVAKNGNAIEPGLLFAGDTLFAGSIGRTDLWGGSLEAIMRSLKTKVLALPDETVVFPGHGPATTVGEERESNPFLQGL
jgi:glyoxylase-like metal-dependent hydrolase (beta-lactamase superfamily II)